MSFLMCGERRGLLCQGLGSYIHCTDFFHLSDQQAVVIKHCPLYGPLVGRIGFVERTCWLVGTSDLGNCGLCQWPERQVIAPALASSQACSQPTSRSLP